MRVYKNTLVHLVFGVLIVMSVIVAGVLMDLSSVATGIILGVAALITAPVLYKLIRKVPKHDDDIHYHEKDEHMPVRR